MVNKKDKYLAEEKGAFLGRARSVFVILLCSLFMVACDNADQHVSVAEQTPELDASEVLDGQGDSNEEQAISSTQKVVGAYFPDWGIRQDPPYTPLEIPAKNLTHVIYAFLSPCGEEKPEKDFNESDKLLAEVCKGKPVGTAVLVDRDAALGFTRDDGSFYEGHFAQLRRLKLMYPKLVVLPSFGGWTLSAPFHELIRTEEGRKRFVKTAIELIAKYDVFDGIDIDWEFPGGGGTVFKDGTLSEKEKQIEKLGYTMMMTEFRTELDRLAKRTGRVYELSAAVNISPARIDGIDYKVVSQLMDHIFVMTYDFFGAWANDSGFHTNLHAYENAPGGVGADVQVKNLLSRGVSPDKIVLGAAFYGRGWTGVPKGKDGMPDLGMGKASGPLDSGSYTYVEIDSKYRSREGFKYFYHEQAEAPFLYNEKTGDFITYDNPRSIQAKGDWVVKEKLGGLFSWELTQDEGELLRIMNSSLGNSVTLPNIVTAIDE